MRRAYHDFLLRTPMISSERKPMSDITTTDKEVKVAVEMPGVSKENIKTSNCQFVLSSHNPFLEANGFGPFN